MKQIVCQGPYKFIIKNSSIPQISNDEALVRIRRIGICGTDFHAYKGEQPYFTYPRILGHEISGEIVKINNPDTSLKTGDTVMINPYQECGDCVVCKNGKSNCCKHLKVRGVHQNGGMQEYVAIPITHLINTNLISLDASAMVECLSIGAHAVRRANITKGETVMVIGAGPIGLGTMKFANLEGAKVIAMDINRNRLNFSKKWASVEHLVHVKSNNVIDKLKEITNGDMPSIIFDATGSKKSMQTAINYVAHGGKVVYVSLIKDNLSFYYPDFHEKEITLLSSRNATEIDFQKVLQAIRSKEIDIDRFITHKVNFDNFIEEFKTLMDPEANVIKAMIQI